MPDLNERLNQIEQRLFALETKLGMILPASGTGADVGGWLYQSLVRGIVTYHPDAAINRQSTRSGCLPRKE